MFLWVKRDACSKHLSPLSHWTLLTQVRGFLTRLRLISVISRMRLMFSSIILLPAKLPTNIYPGTRMHKNGPTHEAATTAVCWWFLGNVYCQFTVSWWKKGFGIVVDMMIISNQRNSLTLLGLYDSFKRHLFWAKGGHFFFSCEVTQSGAKWKLQLPPLECSHHSYTDLLVTQKKKKVLPVRPKWQSRWNGEFVLFPRIRKWDRWYLKIS